MYSVGRLSAELAAAGWIPDEKCENRYVRGPLYLQAKARDGEVTEVAVRVSAGPYIPGCIAVYSNGASGTTYKTAMSALREVLRAALFDAKKRHLSLIKSASTGKAKSG